MMSASPSIDAYDAQMLDFPSDPDVPMHITGSAEFFAEALMDHDGHLVASTYNEHHPSVEVDMDEYVGDNAEYEMADETAEYHRPHGDELLDIEVYDASHVPSPHVPSQPLQPSADVPVDSVHTEIALRALSEHPKHPELHSGSQLVPGSEHSAPLDHPAADVSHVEPSASGDVISLEAVAAELTHTSDVPNEGLPPYSESHEQLGNIARTSGQLVEVSTSLDVIDEEAKSNVPPVAGEHSTNSEVVQHENSETLVTGSAPLSEDVHETGDSVRDEKAADPPATDETVGSLHISDGIYIDPPPAVLLSVANISEQRFALFNLPAAESDVAEGSSGNQKTYSLILEDRPTLYYEPLSSVFEALRQNEGLLSCIPHSFEGELAFDAHDLQLVVSEDNVHSREISLHDLNILHDGSDFVGPLRLSLRAVVPRFIIRYYALQEQLQRLHAAANIGEEEREEEHQEHYDTTEEEHLPQPEEVADHFSLQAAVAAESLGLTSETREVAQESVHPPEPTEEAPQEGPEAEDASTFQEASADHHEVTGEAMHALEDEDDYEGTDVGDEDEPVKSEILGADQVHDTLAEDTDAPAAVTGQEPKFGGEQTEYLDYVQPEEYDERYGEELPEQAGGASPNDEPPHYEEEEEDTSTAADETQAILPGSDGEESGATPLPARAVLESGSSEPASNSMSQKQEGLVPGNEELATSESKNEVDHAEQASGNQEPGTVRERIFSEIEESDSNFVSMLEREADAEFERTFSAEQSGREGGLEATFQHDEAWDEWDDEDAEGDNEEDWIDPDADSNESSITLSSKASKRSHDEVDPNEEPQIEVPRNSPGSKRPRVQ